MSAIKYEELEFPFFVNTHPAITLTGWKKDGEKTQVILPLSDVAKIAIISGVSLLNVGDTRCGKSQMMMDIHRHYFGGDADKTGRSNWVVARNDFTAEGYFSTIDQSKLGEGKGLVADARVPNEKRAKALCNIVDELNLAVPEIQVEFFGMAEGRQKGEALGQDGYNVFMTAFNLNRVNGDFAGANDINRALLNRIGVTIDFDYFARTDEDADALLENGASGKLKLAPIRDISDKILAAHAEISEACQKSDPWLDAYIRIFSSGLEYCSTDKDHRKKSIWPAKCGNCKFAHKDLCSLVKQSNQGTTELLKKFATGINYLINLKHPSLERIDPFDLALEVFKFTTYHKNLNEIEIRGTYSGEAQEQMDVAIAKIRAAIEPVRPYIDDAIESAVNGAYETKFIVINNTPVLYSAEIEEKIKAKKAKYQIVDSTDIFSKLGEETGIRLDWMPHYLKTLADAYKKE